MVQFQSALVFGAAGNFGRLLCDKLRGCTKLLGGCDLNQAAPGCLDHFLAYEPESPALREALSSADLIVLAVTEDAALEIAAELLPLASSNCLAFDILSVKHQIVSLVSSSPIRCDYVSVHPMFAASTDFQSQNVVLTPVRGTTAADTLRTLFESWGARVAAMSAADHDRATAITQVACHASVLSFGLVCARSGIDIRELQQVETPISRFLLSLCARIQAGDPRLYQLIQEANANGARVRTLLSEALADIGDGGIVGGGAEFAQIFDEIGQWLAGADQDYTDLARRVVDMERPE